MTATYILEYRQYLRDFKSEVLRRLSPVIGPEDALFTAQHGYVLRPGYVNSLYKLFLIPETFAIYSIEHNKDKIPSEGDRNLQMYSFCVGADFDIVHDDLENQKLEYCQVCRTKAISDFAAAYLMIRADELGFIDIANVTHTTPVSYAFFARRLGNGLVPPSYGRITL